LIKIPYFVIFIYTYNNYTTMTKNKKKKIKVPIPGTHSVDNDKDYIEAEGKDDIIPKQANGNR